MQNTNTKEMTEKGVIVLNASELPQENISVGNGENYLLQGNSYDWLKKYYNRLIVKEAPQISLESEDKRSVWCVRCSNCGFEAYRPMTFKIASIIAKGHEIITAHIPDIYEKKNNSTNN